METRVYKTVGECAITLDVYPIERPRPTPGVVRVHGGALISGGRELMPAVLPELCAAAGFTLVSIDYRLAPETLLPEILEDLADAVDWVRGQGADEFGIAPDRLGICGHSAGGYLTLVAGYWVQPRPRVLVSHAGYGDIVGEWYTRPDPFYRSTVPMISAQDAYLGVGGPPVAEVAVRDGRERFYLYCRLQGIWPREVLGLDPDREPVAFHRYCPERNVGADYPPTLLIHGTADTDVPYQRSVDMAAALREAGIAHELLSIPGGPHSFARPVTADDLRAATPSAAAAALHRTIEFLAGHLKDDEGRGETGS